MPAAAGCWFGPHRVVEVACILTVDGDERHLAKVGALAHRRGHGGLGLGQRLGREDVGNIVGVDRDQADRAWVAHAAQPLDDLHGAQTEGAAGENLGRDQLAGLRATRIGIGNQEIGLLPPVGRPQPPFAALGPVVDAEHPRRSSPTGV